MTRRRAAGALIVVVLGITGPPAAGWVLAGFNAISDTRGDFNSDPDWTAPRAVRSVVGKSEGGETGYVRQNVSAYGYAQVDDTGNPASGVASVNGDAAFGSSPFAAGSYTAGGASFNYRTPLVPLGSQTEGTKPYSVVMDDSAGNSRTQSFDFIVDNTVPTAADVQAANGTGGIQSRPEISDTVTVTYSEPIDPHSIVANWTGAAMDVVVRINNTSPDSLVVFNTTNTTQLPLGSVNLGRTDYVGANRTFGVTGTKSRMQRSGNAIILTLGTASGTTTTAAGTGTLAWTPSITAFDRAGNRSTSTVRNELGTADRDF